MSNIWISAFCLCGASILGSVLGFAVKKLPHKWNDVILGYCAGIMLSAAILGLILPAVELSPKSNYHWVFLGIIAGAAFLNLLDLFTPHLHKISGLEMEKHKNDAHLNKVLLFVLAIAIHKLPEGIAAGVGFGDSVADTSRAWAVNFGISLQNIPEAMVVIPPLLIAGVSKIRSFLISTIIGVLEIVGVFLGYFLGSLGEVFLPIMLAFAGGAMLYVVSDEMIPETHAHGYQKQATYSLLFGFSTILFLERLF